MTTYYQHASGHRAADVYALSRQPRVQDYQPRPCDTVEFEADERMQNIVLSTSRPAGQTSLHVADSAQGLESALSASGGRARLLESYE